MRKIYTKEGEIIDTKELQITAMTTEFARQISSWKYEGIYSMYDHNEEDIKNLMDGTHYACTDASGGLVGYFCYGAQAQIPTVEANIYDVNFLDIGLGLAPKLCGQNLGLPFLYKGLEYAHSNFEATNFRLSVAKQNERAIKVYKRAGFKTSQDVTHAKTNDKFVVMKRTSYSAEDYANSDEKWDFSDYAFTITGIIVGVLLVLPDLLYSLFGFAFLGGSMADTATDLAEGLTYGRGPGNWRLSELRALSPLLFLLTTTIVFFHEAITTRKTDGYKGSLFTHTFESLFEEAIYMAITTIMVFYSVLFGAMYASWLAGPITWILFIIIFPLVRIKRGKADDVSFPWFLLTIFAIGIVGEIVTGGAWIAFPVSWLIICGVKLVTTIRDRDTSVDNLFNILYYAFSVVLMAVGVGFNFWMTSWAAFPIALFICWVASKFGRYKKAKPETDTETE